MPSAWENVMKKAAHIKFPYRAYRTDGDKTNYPTRRSVVMKCCAPWVTYEDQRRNDSARKHCGIAEAVISDFDIEFEKSREAGKVYERLVDGLGVKK